MEKLKKILMIISLSGVGVAALMLILAVFGVKMFQGVPLRILLIVSTLALASGISINEIAVIRRKKILGYVGLGLLALSTLFAIIIFCSNILVTDNIFNRITGIIAVTSLLFIFIISIYSKVGKSVIALQIPTYVSLVGVDVFLSLIIMGIDVFSLGGMIHIFIILCILSVALSISLSVVSAKMKSTREHEAEIENNKFVKIPKEEYENLLKENEMLKKELEELKNSK